MACICSLPVQDEADFLMWRVGKDLGFQRSLSCPPQGNGWRRPSSEDEGHHPTKASHLRVWGALEGLRASVGVMGPP